MTVLVAIAGQSRSGKGTIARVFAERAAELCYTSFERQLSDNGKWALMRIFRPTISRVEAVEWFEELKGKARVEVQVGRWGVDDGESDGWFVEEKVSLQKFIQHGLQEGGRDIFGKHYWIDRIIPEYVLDGIDECSELTSSSVRWAPDFFTIGGGGRAAPAWLDGFFDEEAGVEPTDLAIISDLRQPNEAERVRALDGVLVHARRVEHDDAYRTGGGHVTELPLVPAEFEPVVVNDSDVTGLRVQATRVFAEFVLPRLKEQKSADQPA